MPETRKPTESERALCQQREETEADLSLAGRNDELRRRLEMLADATRSVLHALDANTFPSSARRETLREALGQADHSIQQASRPGA